MRCEEQCLLLARVRCEKDAVRSELARHVRLGESTVLRRGATVLRRGATVRVACAWGWRSACDVQTRRVCIRIEGLGQRM